MSQTAGDRSKIHDRKVTDKSGALDCLALTVLTLTKENKDYTAFLVFIILHIILQVFLFNFVTV